ncbi:MAG: hypothetical protein QOD75_3291 [Blastocatellia bacterium]|nr:hypothetical protein [Blastocatellia bacterium]
MITRRYLGHALTLWLALLISGEIAQGQSTVFNTPSTDVVSPKRIYVEGDFVSHLAPYQKDGYQLYGGRVVYGLHRRTEIGMNVYYTRSSESPEPIVVEPNFKWQFYNDEGKGLSAAAGVLVSLPLTHRSAGSTSGFLYAVGSKKFAGSFGPRLTGGAYLLVASAEPGTSKYGSLVGYEQPVNSRLTFITDWTSGRNDLGYLAAGVGITLTPKNALYLGYNVGNHGRGNNALGAYYGFTF